LRVARRVADDGKPVFGTPTSVTGVSKHNLPAQTTPFVGRHAELVELARLLDDPNIRLITIFGLGGMGKTRLALEVASAQLASNPQGVYFVSLASLNSVDNLISATAQAVNFNFYQAENLKQQLLDYLHEKDMLLVMDSFDHLLEGAGLVADILRQASRVTILTTSREKLNIYGETVFLISGMEVPDRKSTDDALLFDAVKLFEQSARRAQPHFELKPDDYKCVVRICQQVQGMPLGIELAAAWVEMLTLHEIAEEIGQNLDLLETEESGIAERHRSIRAVFDYSWNCLDDTEQALMKMLSVFQGGCTRKAAQTVTGASLQKLTSLVNRSLLRRNPDGRYEMQRLLRQSIEERLNKSRDESWLAHTRHARYYAEWLDEREIPLRGADQKAILGEIAAELENIRAAWYWAVEQRQADIIGKAVHSVYTFFLVQERGHEAGRGFESAASALRADPDSDQNRYQLGRVLARQGWLTTIKAAEELFRESIDLLRPLNEPEELAFSLLGMGSTLLKTDHVQAQRYLEEGLALYQSAGNRWGERIALFWLSFWANAQGRPEQARQYLLKSLEIAEAIHDHLGAMMCYQELGNTARGLGEYEEASQHYRGSLAIAREIGVRGDSARALRSLGNIARALGQYTKAEQLLNESLTIYQELGNWARIARVFYELGDIACTEGRYTEAVSIFEKSLQINEEFCCGPSPDAEEGSEQDYQERLYQEASRQEGEVYALTGLAGAACGLKNYEKARQYLFRALQIAANAATVPVTLIVLMAIAEFLATTGEQLRSVELSTFVVQAASWQETKDRAQRLLTDLQVILPPPVFTTAFDNGSKLDLDTVVATILEAGI
jgi:predicted ATPase